MRVCVYALATNNSLGVCVCACSHVQRPNIMMRTLVRCTSGSQSAVAWTWLSALPGRAHVVVRMSHVIRAPGVPVWPHTHTHTRTHTHIQPHVAHEGGVRVGRNFHIILVTIKCERSRRSDTQRLSKCVRELHAFGRVCACVLRYTRNQIMIWSTIRPLLL